MRIANIDNTAVFLFFVAVNGCTSKFHSVFHEFYFSSSKELFPSITAFIFLMQVDIILSSNFQHVTVALLALTVATYFDTSLLATSLPKKFSLSKVAL